MEDQGQAPNPQTGQEPGGQTLPQAQATPPTAGPEPTQGNAPEVFPREYVEQLRREAADFRKRATTAEGKVTQHEQEKLSETERLQQQYAESEAKRVEAEARYQDAVIRAAVDREAAKQGAVDPDAVFALMDRSELQVGEDGTVANTEKAVKALLASKPYLVKATEEVNATTARTQAIPRTPRPDATAKPADIAAEEINRLRNTGRYAI